MQEIIDEDRKLVIEVPEDNTDFLWATYVLETDWYGDEFWDLVDAGECPVTALDDAVATWKTGEDWLDRFANYSAP